MTKETSSLISKNIPYNGNRKSPDVSSFKIQRDQPNKNPSRITLLRNITSNIQNTTHRWSTQKQTLTEMYIINRET